MLNKLLFSNRSNKELLIAVIGSFVGITFLFSAIHYLVKVNEFGSGSEILGPNTLIVSKKVNSGAVFGLAKTDFSDSQLEEMKKLSFVEDVKPVISNNFDVSFQTDDPIVPYFRSDVFIQTVDPNFLDVKSEKWKWQKGDSVVPIILPRDFLVMLNTFMSANNIPQVSEEVAQSIRFKFTISNSDKKEFIAARIIGFTNEVPSILVPESFMEYGNVNFSLGQDKKITQIMIAGVEGKFGLLEEHLKENGLESKNSQVVVSRLKSIVSTLLLVVMAISIVSVFLACLVLIQYLQLLMSRNAYEVRTLLRLGYHPKTIIQKFLRYFVLIFVVVSLLSFGAFLFLKWLLDSIFLQGGLAIGTSVSIFTFLALIVGIVLFTLSSYFTAKRGVYAEF